MLSKITSNLIWQEGKAIVFLLLTVAILGWLIYIPLVYCAVGLFLFCFYFFRNPDRDYTSDLIKDPHGIVCPADGKIVDIVQDLENAKEYHKKISIFLSPLDVHVNWIPVAGTIKKIDYVPGKFMFAFLPKSSELNEHNDIIIENKNGAKILVRQIAGTVARRIVCWAKQGDHVSAGQKFGMIKFSSRIDLFLPASSVITVHKGQKVKGGQTIIGRLQ